MLVDDEQVVRRAACGRRLLASDDEAEVELSEDLHRGEVRFEDGPRQRSLGDVGGCVDACETTSRGDGLGREALSRLKILPWSQAIVRLLGRLFEGALDVGT
jgi:hypothetical protein